MDEIEKNTEIDLKPEEIEQSEGVETEGNALFRAFLAKMGKCMNRYYHANQMYNKRSSYSGRPMPRRWREEDKKMFAAERREAVRDMQIIVSETVPLIDDESREKFIYYLKEYQFNIGYDFVDAILQKLG